MAIYEAVFVLRQDFTAQQVTDFAEEYKKILTDNGAKILKEENWGLRSLAYKIKKNKKGHYVLFEMEAPVVALNEFKRKLGLTENVLRFMVVKLDKPTKGQSAILLQKDLRDERK